MNLRFGTDHAYIRLTDKYRTQFVARIALATERPNCVDDKY